MSDLTKRLLTALVLVPAVLAAIYVDTTHWSVAVLAAVAAAVAGDEYLRMSLPMEEGGRPRILRSVAAVLAFGLVALASWDIQLRWMFPAVTVAAIILTSAVLLRRKHLGHAASDVSALLSGLVYVPVMVCVWPLLKRDFGPHWLTVTLSTAFLSDTVAYFAGRAFGKHPLYPQVSPKKTLEGSVGGLVGGVLAQVGMGTYWLLGDELPLLHALILGVMGSILGQVGDLVESMLKRNYGVKDSGAILPGHGGMLDRIDALIFVAPMVYYYLVFVVRS